MAFWKSFILYHFYFYFYMMPVRSLTRCEPCITVYYKIIILYKMEFDSFSEFYEKLNAYYTDKPGKNAY
jgi:hypothetical protein